uniref:Leucine rich pentatricopeptide repeat containing n=1 Tax=Oreochromis niloticus TaxID=8128 RepID=A0A669B636_ORENI
MFFHAATENMAALLRSSRLLKFSPSGVLQITCTKRNGPTLGRLYSGALGGRRTGVCARQIGPVTENASSIAVRSKQAQQFDWALTRLDSSVRRTGRITKTLLLRIFHDICRTGYPSGNQALLLLRSCGSLLPEVPLEERTELAHRVWEKLKELGAQYDVSHYNALLKVYLQNEFKFSPTDFLAKMEAANIQPNRVTYQRLIAAYCQNGDIEGASTILGFMKSKDLPITEAVFSSLVTGHARAGDIESAKNILSVMGGAGIEPGPDTYVSLLNAYAEKGDLENMKKTLEAADSADCSLMDRDIMQVIFTLAKSKHQQHIPEMVERLRHERGYVPDAMNLCLSLITQGQEDTAFHILKTFPTLQSDNSSDSANLGNFFLRHCINMDTSLEKIIRFCKELQESNMHTSPLSFTLSCALEAKKTGTSLELMKLFREEKLPVRPHFFWPLLTQHVKDKNIAGVVEVMKGMQDLDVSPDVETLSNYILPVFPSIDAARQALKVIHKSVPKAASVSRKETQSHTLQRLQKYSINAQMAAVTDTVANEIYSQDNCSLCMCICVCVCAEATAYFLYNLIDSMSEGQVRAQEDKLRKFFSQLQSKNIMISVNLYRGIKNLLDSCHVPELVKDVMTLVDPKEKVSNGPVSATPRGKVLALENKLAELKAENKPLGLVLKQVIQALSAEENLQRALELKQQHEEEMTAGGYAILINLCCRQNNVEEALNLKRELSRKDSSVALDANKYLALVKVLSVNGRMEEAVDILKEMKEKDVAMNDTHVTTLFHTLNAVAAAGDIPSIRRLQDTVFTLGLVKPTANLCSPVVTAYLVSKDVSGALEAALECQKRYNHLPRIHDIIVALVEKGETELLQKAMDFVSQERGEMTMLYDLLFGFLQTGRYREARKIIETPGLRAKPGRLQWYAEKCILNNQMEALEQMVDMTAKLFECDRDEMYNYLLRLCKETNNWQKAEAMWTKMQEENVIPRERTLRLLADILKSNGQEVPFEVPEDNLKFYFSVIPANVLTHFSLFSCSLPAEAFGMLKEAEKKGVALGPSPYDHLIRALLAEGSMDEAMAVKDIAETRVPGFKLTDIASSLLIITQSKKGQVKEALERLKSMLQLDHVPSHLAITRLVQALGSHGDVEGIQEVESLIKSLGTSPNLSSMVFVNNTALGHIKNGDMSSAVELLEGIYTRPDSTNPSMSFVFRKVLEAGNDHAIDKLSAMAERLANHFACYRPASDLFLQLLDMDKVEDAKFMLAVSVCVCVCVCVHVRIIAHRLKVGKIKNLLSLIPDFAEKELLYPYLMKCHVLDKDLPAAKALHEQMQKEGIVVDELSLKRLAVLYREAGETVPFPEPPQLHSYYQHFGLCYHHKHGKLSSLQLEINLKLNL